ncbi:UDP-N-acetylmuramate dehydrogenase [Bdellovibrio sp. SKB1291214]|uniref:UDP-N-acetylmuramate dehydrogenase n=1 Tax=Bdellovibrio sp. SKB1291214 TaxID=1732569 RepID=UPI000B51CE7C|nr:UDP-N-acetylmuramate dehydrogenase [Bdellovibrio sp. SKB1291214]UYL09990.1 UDP-N-acetylmuramate dehydrogenase [Bdellovibrio sp. SKB1291214]
MQLLAQHDLSSLNTLGLKSQAELYTELHTFSDVQDLLKDQQLKKITWRILGGGSNLVLPAKVGGLIIRLANKGRELVHEDHEAWYVKAQSGENWNEFVRWTLDMGFWGLENLSLIPGTVGASPIQNIGAYGVEVKDTIYEVNCVDLATGEMKNFTNSECQFSYRDSYFKNAGAGKYLIWEVTFKLPKQNNLHLEYGDVRKELERQGLEANPRNISKVVCEIRSSKLPDPAVIGNAGSFFKNPIVPVALRDQLLLKYPSLVSFPYADGKVKLAAGWLIDQAGWKGKQIGPVGMFEKQALVLVNHGGADSDDVWTTATQVCADVKARFGVELEPEPIRW